jgi:5-methylcytosine-specific restriction protein A
MWAQAGKRYRWSVAFPIVETFEVVGKPKAKSVLGEEAYRRLYQRSSATLRELNASERELVGSLDLRPLSAVNAHIAIEDDFEKARLSEIDRRVEKLIEEDLGRGALEGMSEERRANVKRRAAWLANSFIQKRTRAAKLHCDDCGFDPKSRFGEASNKLLRSVLDVHHKDPLAEGVRMTTIADFALLCPTCHRVEHARLKLGRLAAATTTKASLPT